MKAMINGIVFEGAPKEFAEFLQHTPVTVAKPKPSPTIQGVIKAAVKLEQEKKQQRHKKITRKLWDSDDDATLRVMVANKKSTKNIARTLSRTARAIRARMHTLHLSRRALQA